MTGRLALLGLVLATMPLAVDIPAARDSSRFGSTRVEVAGGVGQFSLVSRGCNGQVLHVARNQLSSGALVVEQHFPQDLVIGVRAGTVRTTLHPTLMTWSPATLSYFDSSTTERYSNPYVNPYVAYEGRWAGIGGGLLMADHPFLMDQNSSVKLNTTWHVRFGNETRQFTLRWMEDVPLESEGHFSADLGLRQSSRFEVGLFAGLIGPYDGTMLGMRARVWFTPEAALQVKASVSGNSQFGLYGGFSATIPARP